MSKRLRIVPKSELVVAKDRIIYASTRKVNAVAKLIRGATLADAAKNLFYCNRAVAADVRKVLLAAVANAIHNNKLDPEALVVKEAYVGKAVVLRRFMARAKGSGSGIRKEFSRLTIVLCEAEV